jgi:NAD(P)-dependent dehydrogenase (short-subunit alcohol dehydrogenase family)
VTTPPRTSLVVGGTSGIGLAAAQQLSAAGSTVHVASRNPEKVKGVAEGLIPHRLDGADAAAVAELVAEVAPIDALIVTISSSAGMGSLAELDLVDLRRGFDEKLFAMLTVLKAALPHLSERASITLIGAISAHAAMPGTAGIGSVNAAVELAPLRINAISPGLVDTPWWNAMPEQVRDEYFELAEKGLPARHVSSAEEIGEAVVLAATNPSLTGTVLQIDGGARLVQL